MSASPILLPGGTKIAAELDGDGDHVQQSHDAAVATKLEELAASVEAIRGAGAGALATAADMFDIAEGLGDIDASVGDVGGRLPAALSGGGRLTVESQWAADVTTSAVLTAVTQAVTLPLPQGANQIMGSFGPSGVGTLILEVSFDGGVSWCNMVAARGDTAVAQVTSLNSVNTWLEGAAPAGATHVRLRCSAYTSGNIAAVLAAGQGPYEPAPTVAIGSSLQGGTNTIGWVPATGVWIDETSTALGAAGVYTGSSRDLTAAASGASNFGQTHRAVELRLSASSDVAGTLYLEVSRDNATWRRVKAIPLAKADASAVFYGEIVHPPSARYARVAFVNGAGAQAHLSIQSLCLGA